MNTLAQNIIRNFGERRLLRYDLWMQWCKPHPGRESMEAVFNSEDTIRPTDQKGNSRAVFILIVP
jgi:hypothetical protein